MILVSSCRGGRDLALDCDESASEYLAVSCIADGAFVSGRAASDLASGQSIAVWGYVDHGNLYGGAGARAILGEWWGGDGPDAGSWRFDVKGAAGDPVGRSFEVRVLNGPGTDAILGRFVADARAGRVTRVAIRGRLFLFDAPANLSRLVGLRVEVGAPDDIALQPRAGPRSLIEPARR